MSSTRLQTTTDLGSKPASSRSATSSRTISSSKPSISRPQTSNRPSTSRPLTSASSKPVSNQTILSISEARKRSDDNIVALCSLNMEIGECQVIVFKDSVSYNHTMFQISVFNPSVMVMFQSDNQTSRLYNAIGDSLAEFCPVVFSDRKNFNDAKGINELQKYAIANPDLELILSGNNYYILTAISALFDHAIMKMGIILRPSSICFKLSDLYGTLLLDNQTAACLELIVSREKSCSLLGVMSFTFTKMGTRLLRSSILQPLADLVEIQKRQSAVRELGESPGLTLLLSSGIALNTYTSVALTSFPDLEGLISTLITVPKVKQKRFAEQSVNRIISFKMVVRHCIQLKNALSDVVAPLLRAILNAKSDLEGIMRRIDQVLNPDMEHQKTALGIRNQRCFAVQMGFDGLLDVARQTYKEANDDVVQLVKTYTETFHLPIKLTFSSGIGYYLSLSLSDLNGNQLPPVFINTVQKKSGAIHFTSLDLACLNERITESLEDIFARSEVVITDMIIFIHSQLPRFYKISESVAHLDMCLAFLKFATNSKGDFIMPEFSKYTMALRNARHPILDNISDVKAVPNDCYADSTIRVQFVTGVNGSGKTTYLNQIALLQILAQMGCSVPCEFACFRLTDKLLTRIGHDDSSAQMSSFTREMLETAFILEHATEHSLVIIDELGRGTSVTDGIALTIAVAEALIETKAFVFFTTHFDVVALTLENVPNVVNLQMNSISNQESGGFNYKIRAGVCDQEHYGIELAKSVGFHPSIIETALVFAEQLEASRKKLEAESARHQELNRDRSIMQLEKRIELIFQPNGFSEVQARKVLCEMQNELLKECK